MLDVHVASACYYLVASKGSSGVGTWCRGNFPAAPIPRDASFSSTRFRSEGVQAHSTGKLGEAYSAVLVNPAEESMPIGVEIEPITLSIRGDTFGPAQGWTRNTGEMPLQAT